MHERVRDPSYRARLRYDSAFKLEVSYCVDKGIPHSEFLNWSSQDRAKTVAYIMEYGLVCSMCGTAEWEWEENPHAYSAEEEWCKGCYTKSVASEDAGKMPGTTVVLKPSSELSLAEKKAVHRRRARMNEENKTNLE